MWGEVLLKRNIQQEEKDNDRRTRSKLPFREVALFNMMKKESRFNINKRAIEVLFSVLALISICSLLLVLNQKRELQRMIRRDVPDPTFSENELKREELPVIAERRIKRNSDSLLYLYTISQVKKQLKQRKQVTLMKQEFNDLHSFIREIWNMPEPSFRHQPGSSGIVTSCNLDVVCLSNIIYTIEYLKVDKPVELWVEKNKVKEEVLKGVLSRWSPKLRVKYLDEVEEQYEAVFGNLIRLKSMAPYRL